MNKFIIALAFTLFIGCGKDVTQSQEDMEYQKYATTIKSDKSELSRSKLTPMERSKAFDQAYHECGLQEFIYGKGDYTNKGDKTLADLDDFYSRVIIGQYHNDESQEGLRIKFIQYVINAFNLTQPENAEATQHLIKYTRELMKNNRSIDTDLSYKCISGIRGLVETGEYNEMVKKAKFQVRFSVELAQQTLASRKGTDPIQPYEQLKRMIEKDKQYLADFETLKISWDGSDK